MSTRIKHILIYPLLAVALLAAGCDGLTLPTDWENLPGDPTAGIGDSSALPNSYIVVFDENVEIGIITELASQLIGFGKPALDGNAIFQEVLRGFVAEITPADLAWLKLDPRVKYIEPNYRAQLSPYDWYNSGSTETIPWGVKKVGGARNGSGKTAWILDTGIDLYNSDLNVDRTRSRNFARDGRSSAQDGNGHGTHVAGTIGAKDNNTGVVGVAANATLVGLRVLDDRGAGSYSSIIAGLDYVAANARPGDVVNLSLGGPTSRALDDAVRRVANKGVRVVIAAGNSRANAGYTSPARLQHSNVFTVSAIDQNNRLASFSNYGASVDVAAPGVSILSTRVGGGTTYMSGTSMAAPHVTGLLLFGTLRGNGYASGDPDGDADPIAYR